MLGGDMVREFLNRGWDVVGLDVAELDVTDPLEVSRLSTDEFGSGLSWCVNCAAYTAVDRAEKEKDAAYSVNGLAPGYIAGACAIAGMRLLHVSTDFVFDGEAREPYDEQARPRPLGVYGLSKLEGEEAVAGRATIVRTAWLYGPHGKCFPKTILGAWREGKPLRVVSDQVGSPTYTGDLARVIGDLVEAKVPNGLYHAAGPDTMSWHSFAEAALRAHHVVSGIDTGSVRIEAIRTADWPTPAKRPLFSALSFAKCAASASNPCAQRQKLCANSGRESKKGERHAGVQGDV